MNLAPGSRVGHYEVVSRLGEGGMGVVYRALDTRLNRPVAIKVLPPDLVGSDERRLRFRREAQAAAALNHPNICTIHAVEEHDGSDFLVMELLEGQTLRERIGHRPLPLKTLLPVAMQIGEALQAAHEHGVLHRDLKPDNIFVTRQGTAKVLDFGLAKLLEPEGAGGSTGVGDTADTRAGGAAGEDLHSRMDTISRELTMQGKVFGTVAYMSPEQARGERVTHHSDLFSFGVVLYEMATGRQPFKGKTDAETLASILKEEAPPPGSVTGEPQPELERIIAKALEKDPQDRYHHADDMVTDLRRLKRATDSDVQVVRTPGGPVAVGVPRSGRRLSGWSRPSGRSRIAWMGAAAGAAALLAIFAVRHWVASRPATAFPVGSRIVVADFENATGQSQFDTAIRDAFEWMLNFSTYLWVVTGDDLADLTKAAGLRTATRIDAKAAASLCQVHCGGFVSGKIVREGSAYRIQVGLHRRGEERAVVTESALAAGEDAIVGTIWSIANAVRRRTGESLQAIGSTEPPATRSLAALQAVAAAERASGNEASVGLYKKAIDIDPDFVDAYIDLGVTLANLGDWDGYRKNAAEAHRRSTGQSPMKRTWAEINHLDATLQTDIEIERLKSQMAMYPHDVRYPDWLGWIYLNLLEDPVGAEALYRAEYNIVPTLLALGNCVDAFEKQGNTREIDWIVDEALKAGRLPQQVEPSRMWAHVLRRDWTKARALTETYGREGTGIVSVMAVTYADGLLGAGRFKEGREAVIAAWRSAAEIKKVDMRGWSALARAWVDGRTSGKPVRLDRDQIAPLDRNIVYLPAMAVMAVETGQEEPLAAMVREQEIALKDLDSRFATEELEFARACLRLVRGRPAEALPALEKLAYNSILLRRHHVLARTYEALGMWPEAAGAYEEVLKYPFRRRYLVLSVFGSLDQYSAARACERAGQADRARQWYGQFVTDWKDADPDIPELIEARKRLASSPDG